MSSRIENRERWRKILQEQQASGLSVSAFCRETGIPHSYLFKWRRKLGNPPAGFAEVKLRPVTPPLSEPGVVSPAGQIELRLPGRRSVVVRPGFDRQTLIELLDIVEARSDERATTKREVGA